MTTPRRTFSEGARVSRPSTRDTPAARRQGRANFDPYWKLSTFVPRTCAWQEAKGTHFTEAEARAAARAGVEHRLIRVAPGGREVVDTWTP